jgi:nicotinamide-nucleotide amidase
VKGQTDLKAEIISIGDELTAGQRLDTNSQWLGQNLSELGLHVAFHTTVGDVAEENRLVFQTAFERADVVIVTGGLGPTADDLTRQVLSDVTNQPLVRDPASVELIQNLFMKYGRQMPESNLVQADFPRGSRPIHNPEGTAPGIDMTVPLAGRTSRVFCLPGVSAEMHQMWNEHVQPAILKLMGNNRHVVVRVINCFGAGESHIESMLPNMIARDRIPRVGITASGATISLRVVTRGNSAEECWRQIAPTENTIRLCLGDLVFGVDEETLEQVLVEQLASTRKTISIFDFGMHGQVAARISEVAVETGVLRGSVCIPSAANGATGVRSQSLDELISVAETVREQFQSNIGVSIGPVSVDADDKSGFVVTLCSDEHVAQERFLVGGHTSFRLSRSVKQVLNYLRLQLRGIK